MTKHDRDLKRYFQKIRKETYMYMDGPSFLNRLKDEIHSYILDNPNISMDDIYRKYGTPSELADDFFQQADRESCQKRASILRLFKRLLLICFVVFIILLLWLFIDRQSNRPTVVKYNIETNK